MSRIGRPAITLDPVEGVVGPEETCVYSAASLGLALAVATMLGGLMMLGGFVAMGGAGTYSGRRSRGGGSTPTARSAWSMKAASTLSRS